MFIKTSVIKQNTSENALDQNENCHILFTQELLLKLGMSCPSPMYIYKRYVLSAFLACIRVVKLSHTSTGWIPPCQKSIACRHCHCIAHL